MLSFHGVAYVNLSPLLYPGGEGGREGGREEGKWVEGGWEEEEGGFEGEREGGENDCIMCHAFPSATHICGAYSLHPYSEMEVPKKVSHL